MSLTRRGRSGLARLLRVVVQVKASKQRGSRTDASGCHPVPALMYIMQALVSAFACSRR
jgi:hypothetical protein